MKEAAADALRGVEEGSFSRQVLSPLKGQGRVSGDLVTQVDQARAYRNWVAHGRRGRDAGMHNVTPRMAFDRLKEFLAVLGIAIEAERQEWLVDPFLNTGVVNLVPSRAKQLQAIPWHGGGMMRIGGTR